MNTHPPVVLITGALTGSGRATALALASGKALLLMGRCLAVHGGFTAR